MLVKELVGNIYTKNISKNYPYSNKVDSSAQQTTHKLHYL